MKSPSYILLLFFLSFQAFAQAQEETGIVREVETLFNPDSLRINLPSKNHLDSLNQNISTVNSNIEDIKDSLNLKTQDLLPDSLLPANPLDSINSKIGAAKQKVNTVVDSLQQKLKIEVPDSLKNLIPTDTDLLPDVEIPDMEIDPLQELGEIKEVEDLKSLNEIQNIGEIKQLDELNDMSEIEKVEAISNQAKEIKGQIPKAENLSETVEGEAKNLKRIKALEEQKGEIAELSGGLDQIKDQEHYKEELVNKAKEKAIDHFANHQEKLQAAQSKLAELKRKYPEGVSSIEDLSKVRPNGMKGKPLKERLVLGLTVQIHPDKIPNVDLSPFAAYKISKRLSLGMGGSYRLMTKPEFKGLTNEGAVYGYRGFSEFMLHKGIFVHAEYEILKTQVRDSIYFNTTETILEKEWINGLLLGIGKEYKIGGLLKGNMQVLYNLLHEPNSPYQNKVMVRFGFSFQLKDKIKKPDLTQEVEKVKEKGKGSLKRLKDEKVSGLQLSN